MPINFNMTPISYKLTPEEMGYTDYAKALHQGIMNFGQEQQSINTPKQLAENLLAQQLSNKMKKTQLQFQPEKEQLGIDQLKSNINLLNNRNSLIPYAQQLKQAQINKLMQPEKPVMGNFEKAIAGAERIKQLYGSDSEQYNQAKNYIQKLTQASNGITVIDPSTGKPMVQIGGGGTGRGSNQGSTYLTESGEIIQKPTSQILSQLQNRVLGQQLVDPYLKTIVTKLPQFQSGWQKLKTGAAGKSNTWLGTDFRSPSNLAAGKAAVELSAEGMIRQFGLNATTENLRRMSKILMPVEGESINGYKERVRNQSADFVESSMKAKKSAQGVSLGNVNQTSESENNDPADIRWSIK